ncbi:MAG: hypothetical protein BJ554DRAFT_8438 [Olpidium bornovanus]|uniref:Polyprotein n=1 Tax=Olpidium bornovanus TaxID=278681 RepID=A0A8H7ZUG0_9FUNG|nr:MAG: hypothetical protein BJ554DRAFT_8438 [Olpidium bornovanus]
MTRPDLAFAVSFLSRFVASPSPKHWGAVKRALCYLAGTPRYGIHFMEGESELIVFSDADWAGCRMTRATTTSQVCQVSGNGWDRPVQRLTVQDLQQERQM